MKVWDITKTQYKVSDFLSWNRHETLLLSPSFQRRSVWGKGAKSYLIDTILRALPIPIIFLRERQTDINTLEPSREVIDGQQRLRTLIAFVSPETLPDFEEGRDNFKISKTHNKEFGNKTFKDLPDDVRQRILDYQFSVHIMPVDADDREVLQIFARMNSTGLSLNKQELRNAEYFGELKTAVYQSANNHLNHWRKWKIFTEDNLARMQEVEMASEFFQMMIKGLTGKSQAALSQLYKEYDEQFKERRIVEKRFENVMNEIEDNIGEGLSRTVYKKKTLFFILFCVVYDLMYMIDSELNSIGPSRMNKKQVNKLRAISNELIEGRVPEGVAEAATRRTTNIKERKILFSHFKKRLNA